MSLLYECINTVIVGGMLSSDASDSDALAAACVDKLASFLEDADQNLRYMALLALHRLLPTHPHLVARHHDTVLACMDDPDISIRRRALDVVDGMVDRATLQTIVRQLMAHVSPDARTNANIVASTSSSVATLRALASVDGKTSNNSTTTASIDGAMASRYRVSLVHLILSVCSRHTFAYVTNFSWLIDTLVALAYVNLNLPSLSLGADKALATMAPIGVRLADILIDVTARARAIRPYAVKQMRRLMEDDTFVTNAGAQGLLGTRADSIEAADDGAVDVLGAAAWIVGEYGRYVCNLLRLALAMINLRI